MDSVERAKTEIDLVEHVKKQFRESKQKNVKGVLFHTSWDDKTPNLLVYNDNKWYFDFVEAHWGTIIDFEMNYNNLSNWEAIKKLKDMYNIQDDGKKEYKKSPKRFELLTNFEDYRMHTMSMWFSRFLQNRWLSFDDMKKYNDNIQALSKEFWYCENICVAKDTFKDVIIFPCHDETKTIIWWKLRRTDWEPFETSGGSKQKSPAISKPEDYTWPQQFSTWVIFSNISADYVLIAEWETDYTILKILWFESVIWNLWWVATNADKIQQLCKNTKKIICLYDNDWPGLKWAKNLQEKIWRPINIVQYPKIDWKDKYDINDLFKMWYRKEDFDKLIDSAILFNEMKKDEEQSLYRWRFFYNDTKKEYFDVKDLSFTSGFSLARHLFLKTKELEDFRQENIIPTYEWICYYDGWKKWFFNLLDKSNTTYPSNTPEFNESIKKLIYNICNNNEENVEWILKAIIYKYTHINDVLVPAVIFHGVGWSWKWLFLKLLAQIFWHNNTLIGLTQDHIDGRFSAYQWQKLIVEFKELSVDWTAKGKKNMNKLKTFIMEEKIQIEKKWQDVISTENIAWFIMSSNEKKPVLLDSSDSWNRRFTVIKTWWSIWLDLWWEIAEVIKDKRNIENFVAYLFQKFPNIHKEKNILPLENDDKKELEGLSDTVWNLFFKWFEERYPHINKLTVDERDLYLTMYKNEIWDNDPFDERYRPRFFNEWLSERYKYQQQLKINWKNSWWYRIKKDVEWPWYFTSKIPF